MKKDRIKEIVKKYIDEYDLEGLLAMDAPDDEYDPEIREIAERVERCSDVDYIAKNIYVVFAYMFDIDSIPDASDAVYVEIAKKINMDVNGGYNSQRFEIFFSEGGRSARKGYNSRFRH